EISGIVIADRYFRIDHIVDREFLFDSRGVEHGLGPPRPFRIIQYKIEDNARVDENHCRSSPRVMARISSVVRSLFRLPRNLAKRLSRGLPARAAVSPARCIVALPFPSYSNTTSLPGSRPRASRIGSGIVTFPILLIVAMTYRVLFVGNITHTGG